METSMIINVKAWKKAKRDLIFISKIRDLTDEEANELEAIQDVLADTSLRDAIKNNGTL